MNVHFQQSTRLARLTTALGEDELSLLRFGGCEQINTLFEFRVEAVSTRADIDFDNLIGTHATVEIAHPDHGMQPFDGFITQARWAGIGDTGYRYELTLRPWMWLAGRRRNQRIFHNMSVVEILEELFADYADMGAPTVEMKLGNSYPTLEYTVQFGESDLDFACRLMERFGISYFFAHDVQSHTLILVDAPRALDKVPGGRRPFYNIDGQRNVEIEHFSDWRPERNLTTGAIRLTDYNFKTPNAKMEAFRRGDAEYEHGGIESFDWPGHYLELGRGEEVETGLRTDQERGQDRRHYATGDCLTLRAGRRVELSGDEIPGATGQTFVCLSATHDYTANSYGTGTSDGGHKYAGKYVLMPETAPLAPRRKTPLARVHGPHTAVVVGDGEIDCDEHGRILVRFRWDLHEAYSMRCRVSQSWASGNWGGMVIPRIGMEVIVEFLDGDPDKPLVTGCVYNGRNKPPYPLPEHKTKSVFRTDTHTGAGFNEISFEDQTGQENIALHAQKDQTLKVLNNRMKRVDNDQIESVGANKSVHIGKNHQEKIDGSMNLTIGGGGPFGLFGMLGGVVAAGGKDALAGSEAVGDGMISKFVGTLAAAGAAAEAATTGPSGSFDSAGQNREVAGADQSAKGTALGSIVSSVMPMSGVQTTMVEKFVSNTVGLARTEQIGAYKNTSVGHTMTIHAGKEFIINVGKSKLVMDSDGNVTIIGTKFNFSASGHVQINGKVIDLN